MENPFLKPLNQRLEIMSKDFDVSDISKQEYDQLIENIKRRMDYSDLEVKRHLMRFWDQITDDVNNDKLKGRDLALYMQTYADLTDENQEEEND